MQCTLCPRNCHADRDTAKGFCGASDMPEAVTICTHKGEEPPLCGERGICNVFFAHCNLQCIYCQNYDISTPQPLAEELRRHKGLEAIVEGIAHTLEATEQMVGFVTPTHYAHHIPAIVEGLHERGLYPTTVYNTGGYERVEQLRELAPYIDIYLPDLKYMDAALAARYSHAGDYPQVAVAALREMYAQKGAGLPTDERGMAYRGIIVRHLVLPGQVENSLRTLEAIADISPNLHVSLMAQYYPPVEDLPDELGRTLREEEYAEVKAHLEALGLHRGWVQEREAEKHYRPDFAQRQSF